MSEFPYVYLHAFIIIWIGLMIPAILTIIIAFYKKKFLNDVIYKKYCRLWLALAMLWYFVGTVFFAAIAYDVYGGIGHPLYFMASLLKFLMMFSIPTLLLLVISIAPAKWQNWRSKR